MKQRKEHLLNLAARAGIYLIIFYVLFLLGKSLWTNYDLKNSIGKLEKQVAKLEEEKKALNNLIVYYQSDSFKELEARRQLGLKKADEKVVIISQDSSQPNFTEELKKDQENLIQKTKSNNGPNWQLWWDFYTK